MKKFILRKISSYGGEKTASKENVDCVGNMKVYLYCQGPTIKSFQWLIYLELLAISR